MPTLEGDEANGLLVCRHRKYPKSERLRQENKCRRPTWTATVLSYANRDVDPSHIAQDFTFGTGFFTGGFGSDFA